MKYSDRDLARNFSPDIKELNPNVFGPTVAPLPVDEPKAERRSKFGNVKVKIGERTFDSRAEARRYLVLKAQEDAGEISGLLCQVPIQLQEGFEYRGEKVRAIVYTADFVWMVGKITYVEDLKSAPTSKTKDFRLRWRMLQYRYRDTDDVVLQLTII